MQRTCVKCGYVNNRLPKASVCPKCMSPYGLQSAGGSAMAAGVASAGGGPAIRAVAAGGYRVLRLLALALVGVVVVLAIFSRTSDADAQRQSREAAAAAQREQQHRERVRQAIGEARVLIGMRSEEVRQAWGDPTSVNTTLTAQGRDEQWVYRRPGGADQYVYLSNGVVRTVQSTGG